MNNLSNLVGGQISGAAQQFYAPLSAQQYAQPWIAPATTVSAALMGVDGKPARSSVATAISNIMGEVGSVSKDGVNQHFNYKFAAASDVLVKVQPLLARYGLDILQSEASTQIMGNGDVLAITYEFTLVHTDGSVWPEKPRQTGLSVFKAKTQRNPDGVFDDKAANKCHTAARKYFLLALFQIPTGDYDDADNDNHLAAGATAGGGAAKKSDAKVAERPAPPVNPETGEISPHPIGLKFNDNKPDFIGWGQLFLAAVDASKKPEEIRAWAKDNEPTTRRMQTEAPKVYARLLAATEKAVLILAPKSNGAPDLSVKLPKKQQEMINALNTMLTGLPNEEMLAKQWDEWCASPSVAEAIKDSRELLDRAAGIYEVQRAELIRLAKVAA